MFRVTYKDARLGFGIQFVSFIGPEPGVTKSTKNFEFVIVWSLMKEAFKEAFDF